MATRRYRRPIVFHNIRILRCTRSRCTAAANCKRLFLHNGFVHRVAPTYGRKRCIRCTCTRRIGSHIIMGMIPLCHNHDVNSIQVGAYNTMWCNNGHDILCILYATPSSALCTRGQCSYCNMYLTSTYEWILFHNIIVIQNQVAKTNNYWKRFVVEVV